MKKSEKNKEKFTGELCEVKEAAKILKVHPSTVGRLARDKKLRGFKPNRRLLIAKDSIFELLAQSEI